MIGTSSPGKNNDIALKITRTELGLILAITVAGFAARFARLSDVAVEHFDEGVYASNLWFANEGYAYPDRHLYAPPLVPSLIEWSMIFSSSRTAPLLPGVILGSLTVPLLWWVTRRWFGAAAGVAAASLLALNDFHITMSRSALTDVPMVFFLLLAVWLIHEAVAQTHLLGAALGGLATGFAWATKYNGWLALAISVSGTVGALLAMRLIQRGNAGSNGTSSKKIKPTLKDDSRPSIRDTLIVLSVAVLVAGGIWSLVLNDLPNGYSEVSANHSRYVGGLAEWVPSAIQHEAIARHYAGLATWLSGLLAALSSALVLRAERSTWNSEASRESAGSMPILITRSGDPSSTWNGNVPPITIAAMAALAGTIVLSPLIVLLIWSLVSFVTLIARAIRLGSAWEADSTWVYWLALWFGLAWLCGLLLATPVYRPYPRLILTLQCVMTIGTATAIVMLLTGHFLNPKDEASNESSPRNGAFRLAWLVPITLLCAWQGLHTGGPAWQQRTKLADIADRSAAAAAADCQGKASEVDGFDFVVYIYGEPGLLHHIPPSNNRALVKPVMDLSFTQSGYDHVKIPAFVLAGPHALHSLEFKEQLAEAGEALEEIKVFPYRPSDFVLLDDVPPSMLEANRDQLVRLYRVHFR